MALFKLPIWGIRYYAISPLKSTFKFLQLLLFPWVCMFDRVLQGTIHWTTIYRPYTLLEMCLKDNQIFSSLLFFFSTWILVVVEYHQALHFKYTNYIDECTTMLNNIWNYSRCLIIIYGCRPEMVGRQPLCCTTQEDGANCGPISKVNPSCPRYSSCNFFLFFSNRTLLFPWLCWWRSSCYKCRHTFT